MKDGMNDYQWICDRLNREYMGCIKMRDTNDRWLKNNMEANERTMFQIEDNRRSIRACNGDGFLDHHQEIANLVEENDALKGVIACNTESINKYAKKVLDARSRMTLLEAAMDSVSVDDFDMKHGQAISRALGISLVPEYGGNGATLMFMSKSVKVEKFDRAHLFAGLRKFFCN